MPRTGPSAGYFPGGMPYNRFGTGPDPLVVFQGLFFENKPLPESSVLTFMSGYRFLQKDYTVYAVNRKQGLPAVYSMKDMADDYAALIRAEFGGPVDVIGISTGGSIAQHFAADHPELVRRLVIHSSAYRLSDKAKEFQLHIRHLAQRGKWGEAYAAMARFVFAGDRKARILVEPLVWIGSRLAFLTGAPKDARDLMVSIDAEDAHNFKDRLKEICAPALVVAGDRDPFYTPELFRETAAGIPNARLILYPGMGHPAAGMKFSQDVLHFLKD